MSFIDELKRKPCFMSFDPANNDDIILAENTLCVRFAEEYKEYMEICGFAVYEGHELTGICNSKRLNVVDVTLSERSCSCDECQKWYVVEQINYDGIVIWQSATGEIYRTSYGKRPLRICNSLVEYIGL